MVRYYARDGLALQMFTGSMSILPSAEKGRQLSSRLGGRPMALENKLCPNGADKEGEMHSVISSA